MYESLNSTLNTVLKEWEPPLWLIPEMPKHMKRRKIAVSSELAWAMCCVSGQQELHSKILSQANKRRFFKMKINIIL